MLPVGMLMKEHRLIEKMIRLIAQELDSIRLHKKANPRFIMQAVDFIRTYADRCHHGKEEDILFRELEQKHISGAHKTVMQQLVDEHVHARRTVTALVDDTEAYAAGAGDRLQKIADNLLKLVELYPGHIDKEDNYFFLPVMNYFTEEEQASMLQQFREFDRNMIHEKYAKLVEGLSH